VNDQRNENERNEKQPNKIALRSHFRAARRALEPSLRRAETAATIAVLSSYLLAHVDRPLASYLALSDELDLADLHRFWWSQKRSLWLPRVSGQGTLTWHVFTDENSVVHATALGSFGIREPDPARIPAQPLPSNATVLVPGLAFTRHGQRLGQGKGFYDRVLSTHQGHTIGIGYRCQRAEHLPTETHDQPVALVVLGGERHEN
jgi:5-formyltetrahydrofolate cyclo-ligase